ncbi:hypothetical protein BD770DRAFT_390605 [Pilaira anomala]|nr:hypothetical protein BD770DRAFT_390605 [Pilaira anomala]
MPVIISSVLQRFCACCYKPDVQDSSEEQPAPTDITQDEAATSTPIQQEELYPVSWKNTENSPVDLKGIDDCDAIVKKPEDIEQSELHSVAWIDVKKGSKAWGGEDSSLGAEWEAGPSDRPEDSLPLPWEGIFRKGAVPFDGKSFGPSWREIPIQNIIQEQSESTGEDSHSQKSSTEMAMTKDILTTDGPIPGTTDEDDNKSSPQKLSNVDDDANKPMKVVGQLANDKEDSSTKQEDDT